MGINSSSLLCANFTFSAIVMLIILLISVWTQRKQLLIILLMGLAPTGYMRYAPDGALLDNLVNPYSLCSQVILYLLRSLLPSC